MRKAPRWRKLLSGAGASANRAQEIHFQRLGVTFLYRQLQESGSGFPQCVTVWPPFLDLGPVGAVKQSASARVRISRRSSGVYASDPTRRPSAPRRSEWRYPPSTVRIATRVGRSACRESDSKNRGGRWRPVRGLARCSRRIVAWPRRYRWLPPPRDGSALDRDRVYRQSETGGGNAGRPIGRGLVAHQSVLRVGLVQKVAEGVALEAIPARHRPRMGRCSWFWRVSES